MTKTYTLNNTQVSAEEIKGIRTDIDQPNERTDAEWEALFKKTLEGLRMEEMSNTTFGLMYDAGYNTAVVEINRKIDRLLGI